VVSFPARVDGNFRAPRAGPFALPVLIRSDGPRRRGNRLGGRFLLLLELALKGPARRRVDEGEFEHDGLGCSGAKPQIQPPAPITQPMVVRGPGRRPRCGPERLPLKAIRLPRPGCSTGQSPSPAGKSVCRDGNPDDRCPTTISVPRDNGKLPAGAMAHARL
jgi:hypothetical protein